MRDFEVGDIVTQRRLLPYQERNRQWLIVTELIQPFGARFKGKVPGDDRSKLGGSYTTGEWVKVDAAGAMPRKPLTSAKDVSGNVI